MANAPRPGPERSRDLDAMVANVEMTLISIVQGVALSYLADASRPVLFELRVASLPYVLVGLLVIFMAWSRTVLHALTVVRWPLELGHNFLYLSAALLEVLLFSRVADHRGWYPLGAAYMSLVWLTFLYDFRLLRARFVGAVGPAGERLRRALEADQRLHVRRLLPAAVASWVAGALAVRRWPTIFLDDGWHVALALAQLAGFAAYLAFTVRFFGELSELVAATHREEDGA
ncbi:MAG: hypothetical protein HY909_04700 [Deltaproteobacteria bacterium]|nr:hypothetical protein [Deltaproteobacteria bacterium]